jgi:hypothetical protein
MRRYPVLTTVYLSEEQHEQLRRLHERTRVPVAVYLREAVDAILERHGLRQPAPLKVVPLEPHRPVAE